MRPKKRVLLIDSNEYEASVTAFVLTQWGYRVLRATCITEARHVKAPDVVLAYFPIDAAKAQSVADAPHVPLIFVCEKAAPGTVFGITLVDPAPLELLDRLRIAAGRKRGPRKGYRAIRGAHVYPQPAQLEVAAL